MSFWDFMGIGNSAERRALQNQANILNDLAIQQEQQAALHEANIAEEKRLGREAAGRHREVMNINAGNMAAREAEMTAKAQANAAQRALGTRGGSGAGALAGMKAGAQAREGAMAGAFARQQGRQDTARGQLEASERATRSAVNQQQQGAMQQRQAAAQSRGKAQAQLGQIETGAARGGRLFGKGLNLLGSALSDERLKDFKASGKTEKEKKHDKEINKKVMRLLGLKG